MLMLFFKQLHNLVGLLFLVLAAWWAINLGPTEGKPIFTVSKETTYVDGPVTGKGYIDYVAALNKRMSKGIDPAKNAIVSLVKAIGPRPEGTKMPRDFYKWLKIEEPPLKGNYFVTLRNYVERHHKDAAPEKREEMLNQLWEASERPWKAKDYPVIAAWLKANTKALELATKATKQPQAYHPLVPSEKDGHLIAALVPFAQINRELASAYIARAMLHVGEGKSDKAWQDLLTSHRLAAVVSSGATLIEQLVAVAIDSMTLQADMAYLSHTKLNAKQVLHRLKELKDLAPIASVCKKFDLGERFTALDGVMLIDRGGPNVLEFPPAAPAKASELTGRVDWDPALRLINRLFDKVAAACREKDREKQKKMFFAIDDEVKDLRVKAMEFGIADLFMTRQRLGQRLGYILVSLLFPAFEKVYEADERVRQEQRNAYVAFALAAYRSDNGRYPAKLQNLVPAYLKNIPDDRFSGKPLKYRLTKNGYLLYSVGVNGRDDKGADREVDFDSDDLRVEMPVR